MLYSYWENFFQQWLAGSKVCLGWTNPDLVPLYNTLNPIVLSSIFVPEPWWGNDGTSPLHSVVMNYNPGEGGVLQRHSAIVSKGFKSYADIVNSGYLPDTANWHWGKRGKPILEYLLSHSFVSKSDVKPQSHLSIEFIPWHTARADSKHGYPIYSRQNLKEIFVNCFQFAAIQSQRIANTKLNNKVIIRKSWNSLEREFLVKFQTNKIADYSVIIPTTKSAIGNGSYCKFKFTNINPLLKSNESNIEDVEFICIWTLRNSFPGRLVLSNILNNI